MVNVQKSRPERIVPKPLEQKIQPVNGNYKVFEKHLAIFVLSKYELTDMDIKRVNQAFLNDFD